MFTRSLLSSNLRGDVRYTRFKRCVESVMLRVVYHHCSCMRVMTSVYEPSPAYGLSVFVSYPCALYAMHRMNKIKKIPILFAVDAIELVYCNDMIDAIHIVVSIHARGWSQRSPCDGWSSNIRWQASQMLNTYTSCNVVVSCSWTSSAHDLDSDRTEDQEKDS